MLKINERQITEFNTTGILQIKNVIPAHLIYNIQCDCLSAWNNAKSGKIGSIRVYDDFPHIFGGINVSGIDDPFALNLKHINKFVDQLQLPRVISVLSNSNREFGLTLARFHCTDRFKYRGFWHRDDDIGVEGDRIQAALYFFDESGFRVLPKQHFLNQCPRGTPEDLQGKYSEVDGQVTINAKAGDIVFFNSNLLHQPYSISKRFHLHLRFEGKVHIPESGVPGVSDLSSYRNSDPNSYSARQSSSLRRWAKLARYLLPSNRRSNIHLK